MSTNQYFNFTHHAGEDLLHKELARESIQICGVDAFYIPAVQNDLNDILGEAPIRSFENAYEIEVYIRDVQGFGGQGDFLTKFGIQIDDTCTIEVSRLSFEEYVNDRTKPQEGDMIFFPFNRGDFETPGMLFEVHFTEDEEPFYQMQGAPVWVLTLKLFNYSGERFSTGISAIDEIEYSNAYRLDILLDTGSGNYLLGENVHQPASSFVGKVATWNALTKELGLTDLTTNVDSTLSIVGNTSAATYTVSSYDDIEFPTDASTDNRDFEDDASDFVDDFNADNPFGSW